MKLQIIQIILIGVFCNLFINTGFSQIDDCSLDVGGKNTEVLIQVFQLNEDHQSKLETWTAELELQSRVIEDEISQLLEHHPQSTEADLLNLSEKYAKLKDKLFLLSLQYDQKLLGVFNEKQYKFYTELCREAFRRPLIPLVEEEEKKEEKK